MKYSTLLLLFAGLWVAGFGQVPQAFKYQAVVRDATGGTVVNRVVSLRLSLLEGNPLGNAVYVETHQLATNEFGLVSLEVGHGEPQSGIFESINWGSSDFYLKTELDLAGQGNYSFIGTTQLLSVPYALHAGKALVAANAEDDFDKDPQNELQTLSKNGNNILLSQNGGNLSIDTDPENELQLISKVGNVISLSQNGGNFVDSDNQNLQISTNQLSISNGNTINLDSDPTNEIQIITKNGNTVTLSQNGGNFTDADNQILNVQGNQLSIVNGNNVNIDTDPSNEIQTISKTDNLITLSQNGGSISDSDNQTISLQGKQLSISNGNTVTLSGVVDLDSDPTNELQQLNLNGNSISITNGNSIILPQDNDTSSLNELQFLSISHDTLFLTQGNFVKLPQNLDNDPQNEIQSISYSNDTIFLSKANKIILPHDDDSSPTNEIQNLSFRNDSLFLDANEPIDLSHMISWEYPYGISKKFVYGNTAPYTVPDGYIYYPLKPGYINIGGRSLNRGVLASGTTATWVPVGFLLKSTPNLTPILWYSATQNQLPVPENCVLVILDGWGEGVIYDGNIDINYYSGSGTVDEGIKLFFGPKVLTSGSGDLLINGYIMKID